MAKNNNGFADMADHLGKIAQVDHKKVSIKSLENAANFYLEKLIPNVPKSLLKKKHMAYQLKVVIEDSRVKVVFEDTAFYWRFEENGTTNKKAKNFARGTFEQNKEQIENLMVKEIMDLMKG